MDSNRESFGGYYKGILGGRLFRLIDFRKLHIIRREISSSSGRLADIGCGDGNIAAKIRMDFPALDITCIDKDNALLEIAKTRGLNILTGDIDSKLNIKDGIYDYVLMIDSIEHVRSRENTIREIKRILKPEGKFIVFTPPYDTLPWLIAERFHRLLTGRRADHITPFTRESMSYLLENNFVKSRVLTINCGLTMVGVAERKKG